MRIGSLFSGYGGLDMAVQQVFGGTIAWHVEYDKAPSKILAHHYPNVPNYGDVTTVDWTQLEPVDILTGGYPCQPFSAAGKRKGTDDERHLWPYVREAIRVLRPRYVVLENVAGHRTLGFDRVLGDMAEDRLDVRWTSIRASDVGAPHHRERLFILASSADADRGERAGHERASWRREVGRETATGCSAGLPADGRRADDVLVLPTPVAQPSGNTPENHLRKKPGRSRVTDLSILVENDLLETGGVPVLPTPNASDKRVGHSRQLIDHALEADTPAWGKYAPAIHRWEQVTRSAPAPTEPNSNGKPRLNAAFAEWMMGLPAGHVTAPAIGISRADQLKAIGNGVCPQQAAAALALLLDMEAAA